MEVHGNSVEMYPRTGSPRFAARRILSKTRAAPLSWGIFLGETKALTSISLTPVRDRAFTKAILASAGMVADSF